MFIPPHCPNPECQHYLKAESDDWYSQNGRYSTKTFGDVPRFLCKSCRQEDQ